MPVHLPPASVRWCAVLTAVITLITLTGCGPVDDDSSSMVKAATPSASAAPAASASDARARSTVAGDGA